MMRNTIFHYLTGSSGFINNGFEVLEQALKIAGEPELNTVFRLPSVGFKVVGAGFGDFGFHVFGLFIRRWAQMASLQEAVRFLNEKPLDVSFS